MITASSSATDRLDATFIVRAGLAESSCYSFESANFPGQYLRHAGYRVQRAGSDGTAMFQQDATFCAQPPLNGGAAERLAGVDQLPRLPLAALRRGGLHRDQRRRQRLGQPGRYNADVTWNNAAPLG